MHEEQQPPQKTEDKDNPHVEKEEEDNAKRLLKMIHDTVESKQWKDYVKEIELNREYARGTQHGDESGEVVRANLINAEIKALVSQVYAKDPDVSVQPTEAVNPAEYKKIRTFGKTLELVISNQFSPQQANMKAKAKASVRAAATAFIGWTKIVYQKDYEADPEISHRLRDVQDNIERMKHLLSQIEEDDENSTEEESLEQKIEEFRQMEQSLQSSPEIVRSEGLVIDRPLTEDVIWPSSVCDCDEIVKADWLCQRIWMTEDKHRQRYGFLPAKATKYASDRTKRLGEMSVASDDNGRAKHRQHGMVCVYEMWSLVQGRVYTLVEGWSGYIRAPFTPTKVGERGHGFFPLIFDPIDGSSFPQCLVSQLREIADEHNETRTNFRHHRKHSIPHWVGIEGKVSVKDAEKIKNAESMEIVLIEGDETQPMQQYLSQFPNPGIDPSVYTTDHIREDWEKITRRGDAARGTVAKAKTATEANILQQGLAVSSSEAQDAVEEWMREQAQYSSELLLQEMSEEQVKMIAGEDAPWPQMTKDQVFSMVKLEIRAGSAGKPDKTMEQERWVKLVPELRETLLQIVQLRAEGGDDTAEILQKLVEETLVRFDEKIDVEEYFPRPDEEEQQQKQQEQQKAQGEEQEQQQIQMKAMMAEINNLNADTINKLADAESKEVGTQIEQYMADLSAIEKAYALPTLPGPTAPPPPMPGGTLQ
jgi:hypothetical protein